MQYIFVLIGMKASLRYLLSESLFMPQQDET